jgi:hypothetical protein
MKGSRTRLRKVLRFAERPEFCDQYARDRARLKLCQAQAVGRFPAESYSLPIPSFPLQLRPHNARTRARAELTKFTRLLSRLSRICLSRMESAVSAQREGQREGLRLARCAEYGSVRVGRQPGSDGDAVGRTTRAPSRLPMRQPRKKLSRLPPRPIAREPRSALCTAIVDPRHGPRRSNPEKRGRRARA